MRMSKVISSDLKFDSEEMTREQMANHIRMWRGLGDAQANEWTTINRDFVVGKFDDQNAWDDYEKLFKGIDTQHMIALDYGCGPGRSIVKYWNRFARIDGADISPKNIENIPVWASHCGVDVSNGIYRTTSGFDLSPFPTGVYDLVFSTICLQHISVYAIRKNIKKEIYRVLKPGGIFTAQMGFDSPGSRHYNHFAKYYENRSRGFVEDGSINSTEELKRDMVDIGFVNFSYELGPTGPGDEHEYWIYFKGTKPISQEQLL